MALLVRYRPCKVGGVFMKPIMTKYGSTLYIGVDEVLAHYLKIPVIIHFLHYWFELDH